jgi:hypothetical protein
MTISDLSNGSIADVQLGFGSVSRVRILEHSDPGVNKVKVEYLFDEEGRQVEQSGGGWLDGSTLVIKRH